MERITNKQDHYELVVVFISKINKINIYKNAFIEVV